MHLVASSVRAGNEWEQRFDKAASLESGFTEYAGSESMVEVNHKIDDGNLSLAKSTLGVQTKRDGRFNNVRD
jgi:hypothetical protein